MVLNAVSTVLRTRNRSSDNADGPLTLMDPEKIDPPRQRGMSSPHAPRMKLKHEFDHVGRHKASSSYPEVPRKPLIEYCTNDWQKESRYIRADSPEEDPLEGMFNKCSAFLRSPRVRRYLLYYIVFVLCLFYIWTNLQPRWEEDKLLGQSLAQEQNGRSVFGGNVQPVFEDFIQVGTLDEKHLPKGSISKKNPSSRLIFIGDIHGCKTELEDLLTKVTFNSSHDHLVVLGDFVAKGPDSHGVIDLLRSYGASCVRGNHEDKVALIAENINSTQHYNLGITNPSFATHFAPAERELAANLSSQQIAYINSCPLILRIGTFGTDSVVVVHAGLVPGIPLERQDANSVMHMRTIDLITHVPSKDHQEVLRKTVPWAKLWNKYQKQSTRTDRRGKKVKAETMTVVYGHDSRRGLQLQKYSKGIDTGCVRGGRLTALIMGEKGKTSTVSVKCPVDYRPAEPIDVVVEHALSGKSFDETHKRSDEPDE